MFLSLPAASFAQPTCMGSPGSNVLPLSTAGSGSCTLGASGVTGDGGGSLTTTSGSFNAKVINLMAPTYSGTAPNGIGFITITLVNSTYGIRMMFEGSLYTNWPTIDTCASTTNAGCQPNYNDEWLQNQIFTDFSQSTYPMTLMATVPMSNYNVYGTPDCQTILSSAGSTDCGLWSGTAVQYGGCSRMDIDEASQTVACANQIDAVETQTGGYSPYQRTMLVSYNGAAVNGATAAPTSLFNQVVEATGGVETTWGITIGAQ